jgi:3-oxoadipate CoA-transferase beta subunit
LQCVSRVYTDVAVFDITQKAVVVAEIIAGLTVTELERMTGLALSVAPRLSDPL